MKTRILLAAILAFCLTSCVSYHEPFTQGAVDRIRTSETTEADLVRLFGRPNNRTVAINGEITIDWFRTIGPDTTSYAPVVGGLTSGRNLVVQQLTVVLGQSGRVQRFTVYDSRNAAKNERVIESKPRPPPPRRNGAL